jgi:hypothetical protein
MPAAVRRSARRDHRGAREAVGDRSAEAHAANLFDLHAKYADVMALAEVIAQLPVAP